MFFTKGENKHPPSPFLHPLSISPLPLSRKDQKRLSRKTRKEEILGVGLPFGLFKIISASFDKIKSKVPILF